MVVTEPFATAFAIGEIGGSIVVDIGAGTTDIARIHGTFPTDEDQVTIQEAGDWLDLELKNLIAKKFTGAQITKDMVRSGKKNPPTLAATFEPLRFHSLLMVRARMSTLETSFKRLVNS